MSDEEQLDEYLVDGERPLRTLLALHGYTLCLDPRTTRPCVDVRCPIGKLVAYRFHGETRWFGAASTSGNDNSLAQIAASLIGAHTSTLVSD